MEGVCHELRGLSYYTEVFLEWERGLLKFSEMGVRLPKMWEKAAFEMKGS